MFDALPRSFYEPPADTVAPRLLGKLLVRNLSDGACVARIVETEAYLANDAACHAAMGPTRRNRVMFGSPGHAYVYFIYGVYYCVNAVCQPKGVGEAVLIRGIEPVAGVELMRKRRAVSHEHALCNGPGKLCDALAIDRALDGCDLCAESGPLFIAQDPAAPLVSRERIGISRRIGITKAATLPLRFYIKGNPWVSPHRT